MPALPALRIRSDLYTPQFDRRTYNRLIESAASAIKAGVNVIVDAAFLNANDRLLFHDLAEQLQSPFAIVSCHAARSVLSDRIAKRAKQQRDPSDATIGVLDSQLRTMQPLSEEEIDYSIAAEHVAARLRRLARAPGPAGPQSLPHPDRASEKPLV